MFININVQVFRERIDSYHKRIKAYKYQYQYENTGAHRVMKGIQDTYHRRGKVAISISKYSNVNAKFLFDTGS